MSFADLRRWAALLRTQLEVLRNWQRDQCVLKVPKSAAAGVQVGTVPRGACPHRGPCLFQIPALLRLKRLPGVLFAGVDSPEDVLHHTYQELFRAGGFVVSDGRILDSVSLGWSFRFAVLSGRSRFSFQGPRYFIRTAPATALAALTAAPCRAQHCH